MFTHKKQPIPARAFPPAPSTSKPKSNSTNILDFTSPSPVSPPAPPTQPELASTVQPQRRGRPTREPSSRPMSGFSSSAVSSPARVMPPVSQDPVIATENQTAPTAPKAKLQLTGDGGLSHGRGRGLFEAKSQNQPSTDAFGMPTMGGQPTNVGNGFGDSFSASQPGGVAGISRRFGAGGPSGAGQARSGTASSGFSDSFSTPQTVTQPAPAVRVASPESNIFAPALTNPAADQSFETRFPSIDTLDSSDGFSPSLRPQQPAKSVSDLISPLLSPPNAIGRPS
jgi:AP2-associated kinase